MAPAPPASAEHESQALGAYLPVEIKAGALGSRPPLGGLAPGWAPTAPWGEFNEPGGRCLFSNRQGRQVLWVLGFFLSDLRGNTSGGGQRGRGVVGSSGLRARASPQPPSQGDNEVRGDGGLMGLCLWGREGGVPRPLQEMGTSPGHQAPESQWVWHLPI